MRCRPWVTELIESEPITVGRREWVPVVRVRSIVRRQVTFGTASSRGSGSGLVWLQPAFVIERLPDGSQGRIAIPDVTGTIVKEMLIGALVLPALCLVFVSLTFLWRMAHRPPDLDGRINTDT